MHVMFIPSWYDNNRNKVHGSFFRNILPFIFFNRSILIIKFNHWNSKQIPAKIYDYFGADGLIFVILGDENDPIRDVVENKKKCIVVNNNTHEIVSGINKIVSMLENNEKYGPIEEYKWQYISKRLNDILKG